MVQKKRKEKFASSGVFSKASPSPRNVNKTQDWRGSKEKSRLAGISTKEEGWMDGWLAGR